MISLVDSQSINKVLYYSFEADLRNTKTCITQCVPWAGLVAREISVRLVVARLINLLSRCSAASCDTILKPVIYFFVLNRQGITNSVLLYSFNIRAKNQPVCFKEKNEDGKHDFFNIWPEDETRR